MLSNNQSKKFHEAKVVRDISGILRPNQQPSRIKIRRCSDFRSQRMIKYPKVCSFHCLAEYYHAALLEGNTDVDFYVPQPFKLKVRGKTYIPDIYFVKNNIRYVGELKPGAEFSDDLRIPLETFFKQRKMKFVVISNESVFEREIAAQNWMIVIQNILSSEVFGTLSAELEVYETILNSDEVTYGDLIDTGNRFDTELQEAAMFRMLYAGNIETDMESELINYDSVLRACI